MELRAEPDTQPLIGLTIGPESLGTAEALEALIKGG
jgi:hypothetical protein